jgi:hypothetical protein
MTPIITVKISIRKIGRRFIIDLSGQTTRIVEGNERAFVIRPRDIQREQRDDEQLCDKSKHGVYYSVILFIRWHAMHKLLVSMNLPSSFDVWLIWISIADTGNPTVNAPPKYMFIEQRS